MKTNKLLTVLAGLMISADLMADETLWQLFQQPSQEARSKVWWFHGETETTREGIDADLEAFKAKGLGGVVYYDQVHSKAEGALEAMSPEWWDMLKYAAQKARQLGLSFEVAASNGYVAGGPWITPEMGMQQVAFVDSMVTVNRRQTVKLKLKYPRKGFHDVKTLLFADREAYREHCMRKAPLTVEQNAEAIVRYDAGRPVSISTITFSMSPRGKGSTGSMNMPGEPQERFFGDGYIDFPPIGHLEYSTDGKRWQQATNLPNVENVIGHKSRERTVNFPAVKARYFRVRLHDWMDGQGTFPKITVENIRISSRDKIHNWEVKTGLRTEVLYPHEDGSDRGIINSKDIKEVTDSMSPDGTLTLSLAPGTWHILRIGYVPTGGHTKHGRKNLLGLEANVMSHEAAELHYRHYFGAICDTLTAIGCKPAAMHMDSHEAGIQNWTAGFEQTFQRLAGYDITPWLPALAGYIVDSRQQTELMLLDFRKAIARTIGEEYYATFARLCHEDGVAFVSQAMLNIECDNITSRGYSDKPQGEFWGYQKNGNYDCLDCTSAAHLYGHNISSTEAFSDSPYSMTWDELLRIGNLAYCRGVNEFVVCAASYQPWLDRKYDDSQSLHPYIFHRLNPNWEASTQFWTYQNRCTQLLQAGRPVVDLCVYIGEDTPLKTMAYKLPVIPEGYQFDVCTHDALMNRMSVRDGVLHVTGGMTYRALLVQDRTYLSPAVLAKLQQLEREGVCVVWCNQGENVAEKLLAHGIQPDLRLQSANKPDDRTTFYHRQTANADIYFVYNHSNHVYDAPIRPRAKRQHAELWDALNGTRTTITPDNNNAFHLRLKPYESVFIVQTDDLPQPAYLFSYFTGQKDGLHLAYSYDGLAWTPLFGGQSILRPEVGKDRLMRDPSICQGPDGTYHLVWTSSWHDRIIGYASSKDLIHWSEQRAIPVMEHEPEAKNCWAPELFYDEPTGEFYILWATTIPGRHKEIPVSEQDKGNNHRIYCTTTRDFKTFSPTRLYFNPDFIVIDAAIVRDTKQKDYIMVLKNENSAPAEKNLRITRTKSLTEGFPTEVSKPISGNYWCEGPAPLFVGDTLYVYFDIYREGRYGAVRSLDHGRSWQEISDLVSFPKGIRHGTAFPVDASVIRQLQQAEQTLFTKRRTRHFRMTDYATPQAAIDAAQAAGGGTVVVPKGEHKTGALFFPKRVDLWLEHGARLVGIVDTTLYPLVETRWEGDIKQHRAALLNFVDNDSCSLGGEGIIDGNGLEWTKLPKPGYGRPRAINFTRCHGGRMSGVTLQNQAAWGIHVLFTHGFTIDGITTRMDAYVPSSDGIDIDSSTDVIVRRSNISAHDDCISIKSGRGEKARQLALPSKHILIEDCAFGYGHGTVAIGSELSGGISDVTVRRCSVGDGNWGLVRIKSQPSRGGYVENVLFEDITVEDVKSLMDVNLAWRMIGNDSIPAERLTELKNITIRRVSGNKAEQTGNIIGYVQQPIPRNVFRFEDCEIETGKPLDIQYADVDTKGLKQNITTK